MFIVGQIWVMDHEDTNYIIHALEVSVMDESNAVVESEAGMGTGPLPEQSSKGPRRMVSVDTKVNLKVGPSSNGVAQCRH